MMGMRVPITIRKGFVYTFLLHPDSGKLVNLVYKENGEEGTVVCLADTIPDLIAFAGMMTEEEYLVLAANVALTKSKREDK